MGRLVAVDARFGEWWREPREGDPSCLQNVARPSARGDTVECSGYN